MLENNDIENISVSIGNIVKELSNLTGIKEENIGVNIETYVGYWGIHSFDELIELINTNNQKLGYYPYDKDKYFIISIYSNNNKKFH